ncbi:MAG TPA: hypothetical protein VKB96_15975, partial [Gammaproteobacteria bacterium]|nr:hypothetical protein [Gammaproteobacteria bacterium]
RGYKLWGRWALVKTRRNPKDWLLIKEKDSYANESGPATFPADSVLSRLTAQKVKERHELTKVIVAKRKRLNAPASTVSPKQAKVLLRARARHLPKPDGCLKSSSMDTDYSPAERAMKRRSTLARETTSPLLFPRSPMSSAPYHSTNWS